MFDNIIDTFWNFFGWLRAFIDDLWKLAAGFLKSFWGLCALAVGWLLTLLTWAIDTVTSVAVQLGQAIVPAFAKGSIANNYVQFANAVFPLQEMLVMVAGYIALCSVLFIYRFVKSWIPGLS